MIDVLEEFPGENEIRIHPDFITRGTGRIFVNGKNNVLSIAEPHYVGDFHLKVSGSNLVTFEQYLTLGNRQYYNLLAPGALKIGTWTSFSANVMINMHESADITLGRDCLIASDVTIACSPVHKILDKDTKERINPAKEIYIGDHVWISARASIFGGSRIGRDSVVGHSSFVSKEFPDNSLIVGSPAKVVRENITWEA